MTRSKRRVTILGVLSIAPVAIVGLFIVGVVVPLALGSEPSGALFGTLIALEIAAVIAAYVLAIVYAIDAYKSPRVSQDMQVAWLVLLILLNVWVVPVYWWRHIRPTAEPS